MQSLIQTRNVVLFLMALCSIIGCKPPADNEKNQNNPPTAATTPTPPTTGGNATTQGAACDIKALTAGLETVAQEPPSRGAALLRSSVRDACELPKGLQSLVLTRGEVAQWTPSDARAEQDALVERWEALCPGSAAKLTQNAGIGPALAQSAEQLGALYDACPPGALAWLTREEFASAAHGGLLVIAAAPLYRWLSTQPGLPSAQTKAVARVLSGLPVAR